MKTLIFALLLTNELNCLKLISRESNLDKMKKFRVIFPGTKWCGTGDIAHHNRDLGPEVETDKCCRTHDKCHDYISAFGKKHNLVNIAPYTRLYCGCDETFYQCLKAVNTRASRAVGNIYFNILRTKCFRKDYPATCIKYNWLWERCLRYRYDTTTQKKYQWFSVPQF